MLSHMARAANPHLAGKVGEGFLEEVALKLRPEAPGEMWKRERDWLVPRTVNDLCGSTPGVRVGTMTAEVERWPGPFRSVQTWPVFSSTTSPAQLLVFNIVPFPKWDLCFRLPGFYTCLFPNQE